MMTNLLHGAHVANKLFSTIARLRLLLVMFVALSVSVSAWGETWEKVTSAPSDWSGDYLIVYEDGSVAFDGALTTLDAAKNTQTISISNNIIELDAKYSFTIAKSESNYTIKSASGYYIGQTSNANGLTSHNITSYANTISINDDGTVNLVSGDAYLRYNAANDQKRFRYYKSSSYTGQKAICLYKKVAAVQMVAVTSVTLNKTELDLIVDATEQLTATVLPNDATNKNVSWSSDKTAVATVSDNGLVTAVGEGEATITVTTEDGNKTATCTISVTAPAGGGDGDCDKWVEVDLSDIQSTDDVVIAMEKAGTIWALPNYGGTSTPSAVVINSTNLASKNGIADDLKWNIDNNNGTLTIYPTGVTNEWLYCINDNNGVRVGTNENKTFTIDASSGYLKHTGTSRYVGVYTTKPDWRCYTSTTGNIADQTLKFYKYVECGSTETTDYLLRK